MSDIKVFPIGKIENNGARNGLKKSERRFNGR